MSDDDKPWKPEYLQGDPDHWEANLNMRDWVKEALEAKGAKFTGGGVCADYSDIDIELEGMSYNIKIRPLTAQ